MGLAELSEVGVEIAVVPGGAIVGQQWRDVLNERGDLGQRFFWPNRSPCAETYSPSGS